MEKKEILIADKITKIYGIGTKTLYEALHEVSLTMYEGEFVCIMGPSGAGKSTFINNLSTIDIPTKGKVFINGKEVRVMSEGEIGKFRYENLGFIFQEFNLLDSLTIFENIAVPLTLANVDKKEITKRVEEVAEKLDVAQTLDKYPNECSGGQRQRLALARAYLKEQIFLVFDEPTSSLDPFVENRFYEDLLSQTTNTMIVISHRITFTYRMSKIICLNKGHVVESGTPNELLNNPSSLYKEMYDLNTSKYIKL